MVDVKIPTPLDFLMRRLALHPSARPVWVTSDHHWEHPRIREYQRRPANHFELMRERWIERVRSDHIVLHLGDLVCFGDRNKHPDWIRGLPGDKYMLRGNHDDHDADWYALAGFKVIEKPFTWIAKHPQVPGPGTLVLFSHEPDSDERHYWDVNIHGHIHANPYWSRTPMLDFRNVSVEVTGYAPVLLIDVLYGKAGQRRLEVEAVGEYR